MRSLILVVGIAFLVVESSGATFGSWSIWNTNCSETCQGPQMRIRFCIEDSTGAGCGTPEDYIETKSCCESVWGEWSETSACNDTCGGCGTQTRTRTCTTDSPDCTPACEGEDTDTVLGCDERKLCTFPRKPCCAGFIKAFTAEKTAICENTVEE